MAWTSAIIAMTAIKSSFPYKYRPSLPYSTPWFLRTTSRPGLDGGGASTTKPRKELSGVWGNNVQNCRSSSNIQLLNMSDPFLAEKSNVRKLTANKNKNKMRDSKKKYLKKNHYRIINSFDLPLHIMTYHFVLLICKC